MKSFLILLTIIGLFACQRSNLTSKGQIKTFNEKSILAKKPISLELISERFEKETEIVEDDREQKKDKKIYDIMLLAHSRFAFIEYADVEPLSWEELSEVEDKYEAQSSSFHTFDISGTDAFARHEYMIGQTVQVNGLVRDIGTTKIIDIVRVEDNWSEIPYYAAVLDVNADDQNYYGWTSDPNLAPFPLQKMSSPEEDVVQDSKAYELMQNDKFYHEFKQNFSSEFKEELWEENQVKLYTSPSGEKYHVIQHQILGNCMSLVENYTAIYLEKDGAFQLFAHGSMDHYFHDLIDINMDGTPEVFGAGFAAEGIYTIIDGKIELLNDLTWSFDGCPC